MTGVTLPASMSSVRASRRSWLSRYMSPISFCFPRKERTGAPSCRWNPPSHRPPPSPPTMTSTPSAARARRSRDSGRLPAVSVIRSNRPLAVGDVLAGVVDDIVRPDAADELGLRRAADPGYVRAHRLGQLHGERADTATGIDHEHPLSGLHPAPVTDRDQRGHARDG